VDSRSWALFQLSLGREFYAELWAVWITCGDGRGIPQEREISDAMTSAMTAAVMALTGLMAQNTPVRVIAMEPHHHL
jgi:hypothetical protein